MKRYRESLKESNLLAERDSSAYVLHLRAESMGQVYDNTEIMHVIDAYLDIQKRYPNDYLSAAKLGNIYVAGHQYEDAISITEKYRSIDSTNVLVNRINAQAYCLNKDYPKVIERYEQLLQEKDSSFQTCFYAGISYYALEDFYLHTTCWKGLLKMTIATSTFSIIWDAPAPKHHGKRME